MKTLTLKDIKDSNPNLKLSVFVDGKRVNQADFLSEVPTSTKIVGDTLEVFFETE